MAQLVLVGGLMVIFVGLPLSIFAIICIQDPVAISKDAKDWGWAAGIIAIILVLGYVIFLCWLLGPMPQGT